MKTIGLFVFAALAIMLSAGSAKAWNCSDPLAERVVVPATTTGAQGDSDGQLATYNGQVYECEVVPVTPPSTPSNSVSNSLTASNSSSSESNSASNSTSRSKSTSSATGGNSSSVATGGSATGGSSNAGVSNSGNSSVTTSVTAAGGAGGQGGQGGSATATGGKQKQSQSQSLTDSGNSSANGNGNNSDNSTYVVPKQVASAIAPSVAPTVPCFKGYSGGGQSTAFGFSFGGGKIDQNCAELEASRLAPSLVARCKVYLTNKYVRQAGVTMQDCLGPVDVPSQVNSAVPPQVNPAPVFVQPINVSVPAPTVDVTIVPPPIVAPAPNVVKAAQVNAKRYHIHRKPPCKCVVTNDNIK